MPDVLLIAATEAELCGHPGLVCGVGPVEAAVATAGGGALRQPRAVLHVGIAGARGITPGALVAGTEAVYCDLVTETPIVERVEPDGRLLASVRAAFPDWLALPIGTSGAVGGPCGSEPYGLRVEGMEGFAVLRACALAEVPAVEGRAISTEMRNADRARWQIGRGLEALAAVLPQLLAALSEPDSE